MVFQGQDDPKFESKVTEDPKKSERRRFKSKFIGRQNLFQ